MLTRLLFPHFAGVRVARIWREGATLHVALRATRRAARCPLCHHPSTRIHSRYTRTLADLPLAGEAVVLHLRSRRFVCPARRCRRRIFTERLPELVRPAARRTIRLTSQIVATGFALGGNPGVRHLRAEGVVVSARAVLRLLRAAPLPAPGPVRVLGVDDWARRRGRTFGTILVDLEARAVIDLLPDRTADTLAAWLAGHPEVEVVTRDRAGAYAEGIRRGAPQATQVADRFHLEKNLTEALERYLVRTQPPLRQPGPPDATPAHATARQAYRAARLARYEAVVALRAQGASASAIAARVGLSVRTVWYWLRAGQFPERRRRRERPGLLAPFAGYLLARWTDGCHNAKRLYRELRTRGYSGSYRSVSACLATWRGGHPRSGGRGPSTGACAPAASSAYAPRQTCWLLLRPRAELAEAERSYLEQLYRACPQVGLAQALVREFSAVLRGHDVDGLYAWLHGVELAGIPELRVVARSIWQDRAAVEAAVRCDWSNGQVEGQVNKLKTRKRDMFGRAKFDLLRQRMLHAA
jgi:transposase